MRRWVGVTEFLDCGRVRGVWLFDTSCGHELEVDVQVPVIETIGA